MDEGKDREDDPRSRCGSGAPEGQDLRDDTPVSDVPDPGKCDCGRPLAPPMCVSCWEDEFAPLVSADRLKRLEQERDTARASRELNVHIWQVYLNNLVEARAEIARLKTWSHEVCICAAIQLTDGRIIRGHRHDDCIQTAIKWNVVERATQDKQGFITSHNRYVSRREGAALQNAAGIDSAMTGKPVNGILFSEDLYFDSHDRAMFDKLTIRNSEKV